MSTSFSTAAAREPAHKIDPAGRSGWNQRRQFSGGRRRREEDEEEQLIASDEDDLDWVTVRIRIEIADDMELCWLDAFGDPERASLNHQTDNSNDTLVDIAVAFPIEPAEPVSSGVRLDTGALALHSQLSSGNGNGTVDPDASRPDVAAWQMQQLSYGNQLRIQGRI